MPHVNSMSFVDKETLDPASYWHATVEELREEKGETVGPLFYIVDLYM
jgi:hypothetical protein